MLGGRSLDDACEWNETLEQVESSNARDDHGHPLKNLEGLHDARALLDEIGGTKVEP
jgi:hypothetical protein